MADFSQINGKTIETAFEHFDAGNPEVFEQICRQALIAINKGKKRISIKAIVNWLRWNWFVDTKDSTGYKINDAYISLYARKFVKKYPQHKDKIELRALRAKRPDPLPKSQGTFFDTREIETVAETHQNN